MSKPTAEVIADSINEAGSRLTTMRLKIHRFVLPEITRHRCFSFSVSSSRAIPMKKLIEQVRTDPATPLYWGANQPGMSAEKELEGAALLAAQVWWLEAAKSAAESAERLSSHGLHKQIGNRVLEPFVWTTMVVTGTNWENFYALRLAKDAQPEMRASAEACYEAHMNSTPVHLKVGDWHAPFTKHEHVSTDDLQRLTYATKFNHNALRETVLATSVASCARASYLNYDGTRDFNKDVELCKKLYDSWHVSPFEHQATPAHRFVKSGPSSTSNFHSSWLQLRKLIGRDTKSFDGYKDYDANQEQHDG